MAALPPDQDRCQDHVCMGLVHRERYRHTYTTLSQVARGRCSDGGECTASAVDVVAMLAPAGRGEGLVGCEGEV